MVSYTVLSTLSVCSLYIEWCVLSSLVTSLGVSGVKETPVNKKLAKNLLYEARITLSVQQGAVERLLVAILYSSLPLTMEIMNR